VTLPRPNELFDLSGRVALVTGGAGNLGGVFARVLAGAGAQVALLDVDGAALDRRVRELEDAGAKGVTALACDLGDAKAIAAAFDEIGKRARGLDILVNNAGGKSPNFMSDLESLPLEDWDQVLRVNLTAPFLCVKAAVPLMRATGRGSIVNIASIYGVVGPDPRLYEGSAIQTPPVYSASKGGVIALTRYASIYHAKDGIRCNAITPGGVFAGHDAGFVERYSARVPLGRMARADELGGALLYLASDASSYVTGHNLVVDGGWTAW
jgi:NAD(P)-dependent dehydrogenase (short-subunit alcohol dehydrogenase family)